MQWCRDGGVALPSWNAGLIPSSMETTLGPSVQQPDSPRNTDPSSLPSPPSSPGPTHHHHHARDRDLYYSSIPASPSSLASDVQFSSLSSSLYFSESSGAQYLNNNHSHNGLELDGGATRTLIIPSITLPQSRGDANAGEALGNVRLWIISGQNHSHTHHLPHHPDNLHHAKAVAEGLVARDRLVVDVGEWETLNEERGGFERLCASTTRADTEGGEGLGPGHARNVEVTVVSFDEDEEDNVHPFRSSNFQAGANAHVK